MKTTTFNPGSIQVRLGAALAAWEVAETLEKKAMALQDCADYVSVYMDAKEWKRYEAMPGYALGDDRTEFQVLMDMCARKRFLLAIGRRHGVFARAPEMELGDASSLDVEDEVTA